MLFWTILISVGGLSCLTAIKALKAVGGLRVITEQRYKALITGYKQMQEDLARSSGRYYIEDAQRVMDEHYTVLKERDEARAEIAGLVREVELYSKMITDYINGIGLQTAKPIEREKPGRDPFSGTFIPAHGETESKHIRAYRMSRRGLQPAQIAEELSISPASVKVYISKGKAELDKRDRVMIPINDRSERYVSASEVDENGSLYSALPVS